MIPKVIKLTKKQVDTLLKDTNNHFKLFDMCEYINDIPFGFDLSQYKKISYNNDLQSILNEGVIKTYPFDVTANHVYSMMSGYDIEIRINNDDINQDKTANHIFVKTYLKTVSTEFKDKIQKAFYACGYSLGVYKTQNGDIFPIAIFQFEPMYQDNVNEKLGQCLYHITTQNHMNSILKNGFTPKNANRLNFRYEGRCCFFTSVEYIEDYIKQSQKINQEFINGELNEKYKFVIFQVKTDNIKKKIKFYQDVNCPNGMAVFSYANIPSSEITNYYLLEY